MVIPAAFTYQQSIRKLPDFTTICKIQKSKDGIVFFIVSHFKIWLYRVFEVKERLYLNIKVLFVKFESCKGFPAVDVYKQMLVGVSVNNFLYYTRYGYV